MTDSLENLGTAELMTWAFNWQTPPSIEFLQSRTIRDFNFTAQEMVTETSNSPFKGQYSFLIYDRQTEYEFLEFFMNKRGRLSRFWIKSPEQAFNLKADVGNGSSIIYTYDNRADYIWQGYERIWIKLVNGDEITRSVNDATRNESQERIELSLDTVIAAGFTTEDIVMFGRVYLVRCDIDKFSFSYQSNLVSKINIRVQEVVEEYDDA